MWSHNTTRGKSISKYTKMLTAVASSRRRPQIDEEPTVANEFQIQYGGDLAREVASDESMWVEGKSVARGVDCDRWRGQARPELAGAWRRPRRRRKSPESRGSARVRVRTRERERESGPTHSVLDRTGLVQPWWAYQWAQGAF
jgi:hypothetical protein